MSASYDFRGRTVVITGATRGIGKALAHAFAEAGANLILTGTSAEDIDERNRTLAAAGVENTRYVAADFGSPASLDTFLDVLRALPRLDVLVNNAGINRVCAIENVLTEDFDAIQRINLQAPFRCCQVGASRMKEAGYGRILNVASIWSVISKAGRSSYTVSKSGLAGLTRALAVELAPHGVVVNTLSPGFTLTELTRQTLSPSEFEALAMQVPMGRFADPTEMAHVALFLTSETNTYLTGQNIVVDGGFTHV